jgi:hypothetical protein
MHNKIILFFIIAIFGNFTKLKSQNISNGLVCEFLFNNGSKTDSITGITLNNNIPYPTQDRFGNNDCAYYFPSGDSSYFDAGDSFDSLFSGNNAKFSFSFWLWLESDTVNTTYFIISKRSDNNCNEDERQFYLGISPQKNLRIVLSGTLAPNNFIWEEDQVQSIQDSTWYHVVFTYDFQQNERKIYVNCIQDSLTLIQNLGLGLNNGIQSGDANLGFGAMLNKNGNQCHPSTFSGKLDDIRFYDRVLSNADVEKLCNTNNSTYTDIIKDDNNFIIFPNPSNGNVDILNKSDNSSILTIYNANGTILKQLTMEEQTELTNLYFESGTYFIRLQNPQQNLVRKLIILK